VAITLDSCGVVQLRLGEYEAATASLERALRIYESAYEPGHPEVAVTLAHLGDVQLHTGHPALASATFATALAINEAVYGRDHPESARTSARLSAVQRDLRRSQIARVLRRRRRS
jgi:Tfp pilus assembly protein PilF